eukprot:SAG31_NODE_2134_length_6367_cov_7.559190_3_plen_284_part_00
MDRDCKEPVHAGHAESGEKQRARPPSVAVSTAISDERADQAASPQPQPSSKQQRKLDEANASSERVHPPDTASDSPSSRKKRRTGAAATDRTAAVPVANDITAAKEALIKAQPKTCEAQRETAADLMPGAVDGKAGEDRDPRRQVRVKRRLMELSPPPAAFAALAGADSTSGTEATPGQNVANNSSGTSDDGCSSNSANSRSRFGADSAQSAMDRQSVRQPLAALNIYAVGGDSGTANGTDEAVPVAGAMEGDSTLQQPVVKFSKTEDFEILRRCVSRVVVVF